MPIPVRKPCRPVWIAARVGEQTGFAQALRNSTPPAARASMFGVGGVSWPSA